MVTFFFTEGNPIGSNVSGGKLSYSESESWRHGVCSSVAAGKKGDLSKRKVARRIFEPSVKHKTYPDVYLKDVQIICLCARKKEEAKHMFLTR